MTIKLAALAADPALAQRFADLCDVEISEPHGEAPLCTVAGLDDLSVFARDGAGGQFASSPTTGRVFYFSSEGQAGSIARDAAAFLALVVECPYWLDVLHYSGGGSLEDMRRAALGLEASFARDEHAAATRETLLEDLEITRDADPVGALHAAAASPLRIRTASGTGGVAPLFGSFTIDDNPMLRMEPD